MFTLDDKRCVYVLLCLGCVTISFNVAAIAAAIPVISLDLNLPDFMVSKVIPFYMIPYGIGALIYAPLTRYFNYRIILGVSFLLFATTCYVCGGVETLNGFLAARIAMGLSGASVIPLGIMMIGEFFDKSIRGRLVGVFFGCNFFSSMAGVILSGVADWRWLFIVPGILATLMAVGFLLLRSDLLKKVHGEEVNYLNVFTDIKIRKVFVFIFLISALYHGANNWFGVYLSRIYSMDKFQISMFFVLMAIAGLSGQLLGGQLSDKKGRLFACYIGLGCLSFSTIMLYGTYSLIILGIILVLFRAGWTIGHNGVMTVLTDFPNKDRSVVASLNSSIRFIAGGIGFFISKIFVEQSFGLTFLTIGILLFGLSFFVKKMVPQH